MKKQTSGKIKAENYGELLAVLNDLELVSYEDDGGYQGEYKVVLTDGERLYYFFDSYGSCSGCDWLEDERDWDTNEVDYERAVETYGDLKPKYIIPKDKPLEFTSEEYGGFTLKKKSPKPMVTKSNQPKTNKSKGVKK